jgi:hypothetical protein
MIVTVNAPPNQAPQVNAGGRQEITLPDNSITLGGSGQDPDGDKLTFKWTKLRGPGNIRIVSPQSAVTVVQDLQKGTYQFVLHGDDGRGGIDSDTVSIIVHAAIPKQPPLANAGPDKEVRVNDVLTLSGSGSDPDGIIVSYRWTKVSGPGQYHIVSPTAPQTRIDSLVEGDYEFQLEVTDNDGLKGTDRVTINVEPVPVTPPITTLNTSSGQSPPWIWITIAIVALGGATYGFYLFWWWRQPNKVIVYFMNDEEEALARELMPAYERTDGFLLGYTSRRKIRRMRKKGIVLRILDTSIVTVNTPGVSRTYKISYKKGVPNVRPERPVYPGKNFINILQRPHLLQPPQYELPAFYIITLDGPLLPAFTNMLEEIGLSILQRVPYDSYIIYVKDYDQLHQLSHNAEFSFIRVLNQYTAADTGFTVRKDHYDNIPLVNPYALLEMNLVLHREEDAPIVNDFLRVNNVERISASGNTIRIRMRPDTRLPATLAANKYIQAIYEHVPLVWYNDKARQMIGLDDYDNNQPTTFAETGKDQIIAVADTGIYEEHPDLSGRIEGTVAWGRTNNTTDPHGHGTHVAGTIVGNGSASNGLIKGIAPGAKLFFQSLLDDNNLVCDLKLKLPDLLKEAYEQQARIMNISWGAPTEGYYTFDTTAIDMFVYQHPDMLVVVAAGNEGRTLKDKNGKERLIFGSVGSPATTMNGFTVGANNSKRNKNPELISPFSSKGPCKSDRRVKPDIVAPGADILSTKSSEAPDRNFDVFYKNEAYVFMTGTSMATPMVSGAAAIVREYYNNRNYANPSAALIKATLINGTQQLTGENALEDRDLIPNNCQGFGMLNLKDAIPDHTSKFRLWFRDAYGEPSLKLTQTDQRQFFQLQLKEQSWIRACMVFIDDPANRSDIDLIIAFDGTDQKWTGNAGINAKDQYYSDRQNDFTNNIEIIRIGNAASGRYTIEVVATNNQARSGVIFSVVVTTGDMNSESITLQS